MQRRQFITLVGSTVMAWPLSARAQQSAMPVMDYLSAYAPEHLGFILKCYMRAGRT
jgi:hypothetical protein